MSPAVSPAQRSPSLQSETPLHSFKHSELFLNLALIYFSGFMPRSYCFEDDSFMGHFNPGLCLESLVPLSPQEGRGEGLKNGQGGGHLTQ